MHTQVTMQPVASTCSILHTDRRKMCWERHWNWSIVFLIIKAVTRLLKKRLVPKWPSALPKYRRAGMSKEQTGNGKYQRANHRISFVITLEMCFHCMGFDVQQIKWHQRIFLYQLSNLCASKYSFYTGSFLRCCFSIH